VSGIQGVFGQGFAEQINFLRRKLNLPTERWDDIQKSAHNRAFIVTGAQKADLLDSLRRTVDGHIKAGLSVDDFRKNFRSIVEKHGWHGWTGEGTKGGEAWRTRVIYETNLRTSYAAGRHAQLTDPGLLKRRPYWQYVHSGAEHARKEHKAWGDAKLTLPHDHPFWETNYPPNGWGCGCTVRAVPAPEKDAATSPPKGWDVPDPKTGMPPGIDKGWDYAPGANGTTPLLDLVGQKLFNLDARIGASMWEFLAPAIELEQSLALKDMVDAVARTMQAKGTTLLVGAMDTSIVQMLCDLGHPPETVDLWLRDEELLHAIRESKRDRLAALPLDVWRSLPAKLKTAEPWFDTKEPALVYKFDLGGSAGKFVFRINYAEKVSNHAGRRRRLKSNFIRTGGIVKHADIAEPQYVFLGKGRDSGGGI